jgi:KaiC/GvpD/RAD55 family RecA-like ATPase
MTRIVICGGPRTGKTTLAEHMAFWGVKDSTEQTMTSGMGLDRVRHTDDLIALGWSEGSAGAALWFALPGPWIIEGVAVSRALRKWREAHPGEPPPVDRVIRLTTPHVALTKGQAAMAKGEATVWVEVEDWLREHGVEIEER